MNVVQEINRIKAVEAKHGIFGGNKASWHEKYKLSAWVYLGGLSYELSEGDVICFMSQWGEIEDINLVRDKDTGKSLGFCFVKYEDQRSTVLAVDNFNGITLLDRTLRCDHVDKYKLPKEIREKEEEAIDEDPTRNISIGPGHAYRGKELENDITIDQGTNLWKKPTGSSSNSGPSRALLSKGDPLEANVGVVLPNDGYRKESKHMKEKKKKKHKHHSDDEKRRESKESKHKSRSSDRKSIPVPTQVSTSRSDVIIAPPVAASLTALAGAVPASSSWRGRFDPVAPSGNNSSSAQGGWSSSTSYSGQKRPYPPSSSAVSTAAPPSKRGTIFESTGASFGGMARRR